MEAPVYGSIILAGILLRIGRYGIIRLVEIFFKVVINYRYLIFSIRIIGRLLVRLFNSNRYEKISSLFISSSYKLDIVFFIDFKKIRNFKKIYYNSVSWVMFIWIILYS